MTFWRVGKGLADLSPRRLPRHHPSFLRSAAPPLCPALDLSWLLPHPWGTSSGTHLSTPAYSRIAVLASCLLLGQLYFSWLSAFCRFSCISVMWPPQPHYIFSGICLGSWKIPTGNPRPCPCSLPPPPQTLRWASSCSTCLSLCPLHGPRIPCGYGFQSTPGSLVLDRGSCMRIPIL